MASQRDIRILFLKIFDRLHNMITIAGKSPESQKRIAEETNNIYVPLAKRC
jgi:GTP pyrophosphokinase